MPEIRKKVVPISINYRCDNCGNFIYGIDRMICIIPPIWQYVCSNNLCNKTYEFRETYPRIEYEEVE